MQMKICLQHCIVVPRAIFSHHLFIVVECSSRSFRKPATLCFTSRRGLFSFKIAFEGIPLADRWEEFSGIRVQFSQMEQVGWFLLVCNRCSQQYQTLSITR